MSYNTPLLTNSQYTDNTALFLKSHIRHWVSINSITGSFAEEIAKVFHNNIEVTMIEPTSSCCDISSITDPNASVF